MITHCFFHNPVITPAQTIDLSFPFIKKKIDNNNNCAATYCNKLWRISHWRLTVIRPWFLLHAKRFGQCWYGSDARYHQSKAYTHTHTQKTIAKQMSYLRCEHGQKKKTRKTRKRKTARTSNAAFTPEWWWSKHPCSFGVFLIFIFFSIAGCQKTACRPYFFLCCCCTPWFRRVFTLPVF